MEEKKLSTRELAKRLQEKRQKQLESFSRKCQSENNASLASTSTPCHPANRTAPAGSRILNNSNLLNSSVKVPVPQSEARVSHVPRPREKSPSPIVANELSPVQNNANKVSIRRRTKSEYRNTIPEEPTPLAQRSSSQSFIYSTKEKLYVNDNEYAVIRLLGKGGSCKVYEVLSESNEALAIKVVDLDETEEQRNAYMNEIKLLQKLRGAKHIITMIDYELCEEEKVLYVVLEKGDTDFNSFLRSRLKEESIDSFFIHFYWKEMLKCVKVIHDHNIVHADLKPANFLLVKGHLKLIDFGIASAIPKNQTSIVKETQMGTLSYMAPEMCLENKNSGLKLPLKADVWSLGCILYNIVYGRLPFNHISGQLMKIAAIVNPNYPIQFDDCGDIHLLDTLKICLERDLSKRADVDRLLEHPYLTGSNNVPTSPPTSARLLEFAADIKENTPNTIVRKLKSLMVLDNTAKQVLNFDDA